MKKLVLVAIVLLVLGVASGALSISTFDRAGTTGDRAAGHLDRVNTLTESARSLPASSAERALAEAYRYQNFAANDQEEQDEQTTLAWLLAALSAIMIMAGLLLAFAHRRQRVPAA